MASSFLRQQISEQSLISVRKHTFKDGRGYVQQILPLLPLRTLDPLNKKQHAVSFLMFSTTNDSISAINYDPKVYVTSYNL